MLRNIHSTFLQGQGQGHFEGHFKVTERKKVVLAKLRPHGPFLWAKNKSVLYHLVSGTNIILSEKHPIILIL